MLSVSSETCVYNIMYILYFTSEIYFVDLCSRVPSVRVCANTSVAAYRSNFLQYMKSNIVLHLIFGSL